MLFLAEFLSGNGKKEEKYFEIISMNRIRSFIFLFLFAIITSSLYAQSNGKVPNLKLYLTDDKTSYLDFHMLGQVWMRYIWNNPDYNGVEQYSDIDLGLRRTRLTFHGCLFERAYIFTQLGYDNFTYRSPRKPGINLYNAEAEYVLIKDRLHFGLGLNNKGGISRYSNHKNFEFLTLDMPGYVMPVGGTFDDFGRQLGIFIRGTYSKMNYRLSFVKPFEYGTDSISSPITTERINENFAVKGYFNWQFFDKQDVMFNQYSMNNLGRNKILDVGAGFYYHPEAMLVEAEKDISTVDPFIRGFLQAAGNYQAILDLAGYYPSRISDIFVGAVDVFIDMPTKNKGAITGYLGYFYNFFGPDYLRGFGRMNVSRMSADDALPQGTGNSEWEVGTGHIVRGEFGYLLPGNSLKNRFQPYGAFSLKKFEGLDQASAQLDAGINWLMYSHNLKWTLQYSTRPVYTEEDGKEMWTSSKGTVLFQTQIFF